MDFESSGVGDSGILQTWSLSRSATLKYFRLQVFRTWRLLHTSDSESFGVRDSRYFPDFESSGVADSSYFPDFKSLGGTDSPYFFKTPSLSDLRLMKTLRTLSAPDSKYF